MTSRRGLGTARADRRSACSGETGFVATEWAVGVAVMLVPVLLLVAVLPTWTARQEAAAAAAREGTRAAAQAIGWAEAADRAHQAASAVLHVRGVEGADVHVDLPPAAGDGLLPREGVLTVLVTVARETVPLPGFGVVTGPTVTGRHSVQLDPHRSRG